VSPA
jgi:hypothetical protein